MDKECVLILSGGIDSVVLLHLLKSMGYKVYALTFDYGQRHSKEIKYAEYWAMQLCEGLEIIDLKNICNLVSRSSLTGKINLYDNPRDTVVPNRNMIMLSIAVGWAENLQINEVYFGANLTDYEIYPDCRQEYIVNLNKASELGTYNSVKIKAPFIGMLKSDIIKLGKLLDVDFSKTWTCYKGSEKHCGKCPSCISRINAFNEANIIDSVEYDK